MCSLLKIVCGLSVDHSGTEGLSFLLERYRPLEMRSWRRGSRDSFMCQRVMYHVFLIRVRLPSVYNILDADKLDNHLARGRHGH